MALDEEYSGPRSNDIVDQKKWYSNIGPKNIHIVCLTHEQRNY